MSQSNLSARRRRAPQSLENTPSFSNNSSQVTPNNSQNVNSVGLTLPQVINILDNRLIKVETLLNESNNNNNKKISNEVQEELLLNKQSELINEFNNRFEILAEEIAILKDIVLKLQSYTMEINKTLLNERINVMSDLNNNIQVSDIDAEISDTQ